MVLLFITLEFQRLFFW